MATQVIQVQNEAGLHARPASMFVKVAKEFTSKIEVKKDEITINGKSMLALLSISVSKGDEIELIANGEDEEKALKALIELFDEMKSE